MADSQTMSLSPALDVGAVIGVIIFLILLIVGAYFLTKYVGRGPHANRGTKGEPKRRSFFGFAASSASRVRGPRMYIVDRLAVDRDKSIMVVEFEGKYYMIGASPQGFQRIDRIDVPPEEVVEETAAGDGSSQNREDAPGAEAGAPAEEPPASPAQAYAVHAGQKDPEGTFGQRFRTAFGIVLRSYLPKGMRERAPQRSFDEELRARMQRDAEADGRRGPGTGTGSGVGE